MNPWETASHAVYPPLPRYRHNFAFIYFGGSSDLGGQKGDSLWFRQSRNIFERSFTIDPRLDSLAGEVMCRSVFVQAQPKEENGHAESEMDPPLRGRSRTRRQDEE
jgi:hypothetical protein